MLQTEILDSLQQLPESLQQEVLHYIEFLKVRYVQPQLEKNQKNSEETTSSVKRRVPPASIAGKGKTLGDIVRPIVDEEGWECLK